MRWKIKYASMLTDGIVANYSKLSIFMVFNSIGRYTLTVFLKHEKNNLMDPVPSTFRSLHLSPKPHVQYVPPNSPHPPNNP